MQMRIEFKWIFAASFAIAAMPATAQYPSRPILLVVPFTPGTGIDILARTLGPRLSERLGQAVAVDNKAGASSLIGTEFVARAAPDGHTLLVTATSLTITAALNKKLPYDVEKSFAPISFVATGTTALVVGNNTPAQNVGEFVALAKSKTGTLNYGSPGVGTGPHLAMELFKQEAGISMTHIPYKGAAGSFVDLIGGRIDAMFQPIHASLTYLQQGKLRMLAILADNRSAVVPNVPTMKEAGYPNVQLENWYGILAPAATPRDIVARLNSEINAQLGTASVKEELSKQGLATVGGSPSRLEEVIRSELVRWARVVEKGNIKAE